MVRRVRAQRPRRRHPKKNAKASTLHRAGGRARTRTRGAAASRRFDGHVVPPQTGPQEPQHQAHACQRLCCLEAIPMRKRRQSQGAARQRASKQRRDQRRCCMVSNNSTQRRCTGPGRIQGQEVVLPCSYGKGCVEMSLEAITKMRFTRILADCRFPMCSHRQENVAGF